MHDNEIEYMHKFAPSMSLQLEVLGQVAQIWINLIQNKWEYLFDFCNIAVRFSLYIVWTVLSFNSLKLHNIKTMKLYLLNNSVLISKLNWLEPTIQAKTSTWSAVNFKKNMWPWWAQNLSQWYGQMILVSRYHVLTTFNWP